LGIFQAEKLIFKGAGTYESIYHRKDYLKNKKIKKRFINKICW